MSSQISTPGCCDVLMDRETLKSNIDTEVKYFVRRRFFLVEFMTVHGLLHSFVLCELKIECSMGMGRMSFNYVCGAAEFRLLRLRSIGYVTFHSHVTVIAFEMFLKVDVIYLYVACAGVRN
jgi:hypothetical protein